MLVQVALPIPVFKIFTYRVPLRLEPFMKPRVRVRVPFAKRSLTGFVVAVEKDQEDCSFTPSDINEVIDLEPLVDSIGFNLCSWAANHYCVALGFALKASFPLGPDLERYLTVSTGENDPLGIDGLRLKRACTRAGKERVWDHYSKGLLEVRDVFTGGSLKPATSSASNHRFSATLLLSHVESRQKYYLSIMLPVLESGSNVLMLLPDHGVAGEHFHRFLEENLRERVLSFGSKTPAKQRGEVYFRMKKQGGYLVVGTRSCLFLPIGNTRLIIVERPEDDGYRNDQTLQFSAVALAAKLAELQDIPICYGSVSPPLGVMKGVEEGAIDCVGGELAKKPMEITKVDGFRMGDNLPQELIDILAEALSRDERIVIHTPLKDYAARLYCMSCRRSIVCPICQSAVSFRKADNRLVCWRCGRQFPYDEHCTHCGSEAIRFSSTGAEYIEEHIRTAITDGSVIKITGEAVKSRDRGRLIDLVKKPRTIIVGTQILSKFYEIGPIGRLILVGWEDLMRIAGYRAREHMYQTYCNLIDALRPARVHLLTTGRAREPEEVLTMTDEDFYRQELEQRRLAEFPPYVRLFLLRVESKNRASTSLAAKRLRALLDEHGLQENVIGEAIHPGEKGSVSILIKGEGASLERLLPEITKVRHVRIEADPPWV